MTNRDWKQFKSARRILRESAILAMESYDSRLDIKTIDELTDTHIQLLYRELRRLSIMCFKMGRVEAVKSLRLVLDSYLSGTIAK